MKAAAINAYGGPDVISVLDVPAPELHADDVLVRVAATSFNPVDAAIRSGAFQKVLNLVFPYILGSDVAGVVERIGSSVTDFRVGNRVYGYLERARNGGAAEFVACRAALLSLAPSSISLGDAASLPLVSCTAWQALFEHVDLRAAQSFLIAAAAGGVGTVAVQLATWKGAVVTAAASSRHAELLNSLGADRVVLYDRMSTLGATEPQDAVLNLSAASPPDVTGMLSRLKPGGILVSTATPADADEATRLGVRAARMVSRPSGEHLREVAALVDAGEVRPVIAQRVPIEDLRVVHQATSHGYGKVVIVVNQALARQ